MRTVPIVLACALAGCFPDLSGFEVQAGDAGRLPPGTDAGPPRPGEDAGRPGPRFGGPCARPTLFVVAQSLGDSPTELLRYEVHGTAGLVPCGSAVAEGELVAQPFAVAAVDDRFALVAGRDGVDGVDPIDDRRLFHADRFGMHPNDAFAVVDPVAGDRAALVAWSRTASSARLRGNIVELVLYAADGTERRVWSSSELSLGSTTTVAASRRAPSEALAVNSSNFAAAELDLFAGTRREPALLGVITGTLLETLHAGRTRDGRDMFVWTGQVEAEPGILAARDPYTDPMLNDLVGTNSCSEDPCDAVHAIVDPTFDRAVIAVCHGPNGRTLTRFDFGASACQALVDSAALGELRPWYAAILE